MPQEYPYYNPIQLLLRCTSALLPCGQANWLIDWLADWLCLWLLRLSGSFHSIRLRFGSVRLGFLGLGHVVLVHSDTDTRVPFSASYTTQRVVMLTLQQINNGPGGGRVLLVWVELLQSAEEITTNRAPQCNNATYKNKTEWVITKKLHPHTSLFACLNRTQERFGLRGEGRHRTTILHSVNAEACNRSHANTHRRAPKQGVDWVDDIVYSLFFFGVICRFLNFVQKTLTNEANPVEVTTELAILAKVQELEATDYSSR